MTGPIESQMHGRSDAEVFGFVMNEAARLRPSMRDAITPLYRFCWSTNPWSRGTFHYWSAGDVPVLAGAFRGVDGRLAFAGEHTMLSEMGMEAAMASGVQAAFEIMDVL
jgi:monoamine oxidase